MRSIVTMEDNNNKAATASKILQAPKGSVMVGWGQLPKLK